MVLLSSILYNRVLRMGMHNAKKTLLNIKTPKGQNTNKATYVGQQSGSLSMQCLRIDRTVSFLAKRDPF